MQTIVLRRPLIPIFSPQNACRVPHEGFVNDEKIGTLFYDPVTRELFPESVTLLEKLGYNNYIIEMEE